MLSFQPIHVALKLSLQWLYLWNHNFKYSYSTKFTMRSKTRFLYFRDELCLIISHTYILQAILLNISTYPGKVPEQLGAECDWSIIIVDYVYVPNQFSCYWFSLVDIMTNLTVRSLVMFAPLRRVQTCIVGHRTTSRDNVNFWRSPTSINAQRHKYERTYIVARVETMSTFVGRHRNGGSIGWHLDYICE